MSSRLGRFSVEVSGRDGRAGLFTALNEGQAATFDAAGTARGHMSYGRSRWPGIVSATSCNAIRWPLQRGQLSGDVVFNDAWGDGIQPTGRMRLSLLLTAH